MRRSLDYLTRIGFWSGGFPDDRSLPSPTEMVDAAWDEEERAQVIAHLEQGEVVARFRGFSSCRICGKPNGAAERSDGAYLWPSGFAHYLAEHGARPDSTFVSHVLERL